MVREQTTRLAYSSEIGFREFNSWGRDLAYSACCLARVPCLSVVYTTTKRPYTLHHSFLVSSHSSTMAFLSKETLTLTGGCFCGACRYTVSVPVLEDRPLHPTAKPTPISSTESVETRIPVIDIDHCETCRRASGAIIQVWFICPADWVKWELQSTAGATTTYSTADAVGPEPNDQSTHLKRFQATDRATRSFCGKCGTNLTYYSHKRHGPQAVVDIAVGSMDEESLTLAKPDRHGWWDSGFGWIKDLVWKGSGFLVKHPTGDMAQVIEES